MALRKPLETRAKNAGENFPGLCSDVVDKQPKLLQAQISTSGQNLGDYLETRHARTVG